MQREYAIRQTAKREGYRLEKQGDESYRLINERLNVIVYDLDGFRSKQSPRFWRSPKVAQIRRALIIVRLWSLEELAEQTSN